MQREEICIKQKRCTFHKNHNAINSRHGLTLVIRNHQKLPIDIQENAADTATKEWLANMMGNQRQESIMAGRNSRKFSVSDRPRRSTVMGTLARFMSISHNHLERRDTELEVHRNSPDESYVPTFLSLLQSRNSHLWGIADQSFSSACAC